MVAVGSLSGRYINVSITDTDLDTIKLASKNLASNRDSIGGYTDKIWDKIVDWFCGTKREEAKKCLFDLYSEVTTDVEKQISFYKLKELAGNAFKSKFIEDYAESKLILKIEFEDHDPYKLERNIINVNYIQSRIKKDIDFSLLFEKESSNNIAQIDKDIIRSDYLIANEKVIAYDAFVNKLSVQLACNDIQLEAIRAIAHQRLFATIIDSAVKENGGVLDPVYYLTFAKVSYDFIRDGANIKLHAQCIGGKWIEQNMEGPISRPDFLTNPVISINLTINHLGNVEINKVNCYT